MKGATHLKNWNKNSKDSSKRTFFFPSFNFSFYSSAALRFLFPLHPRLTKGFLQIQPCLQGVCKKMSKYHLQQEVCKAACAGTLSAPETAQSLSLTSLFFILFQKQEKVPLTVSK